MVRRASNPPDPWRSEHVEWLDEPPLVLPEVHEERARSILSRNDSPDIPFRYSVNPYRGCAHACAYCYARPTHQYLGWGAGTDFDSRLVVKTNAPDLLRAAFLRRSWSGERIAFSGITDCYQPVEASYGLTRACLSVCRDFRNPVVIVTKSALVCRDIALLAELSSVAAVTVFVSVPWLDEDLARALEPGAPSIARRLDTLGALSAAGLTTGVALAPVVPGLSESHVPGVLARARAAGASRAFLVALRLPAEVEDVFVERLRAALPQRAEHVLSALRDVRGGALSSARFGERMGGRGPRWKLVQDVFAAACRSLGLRAREADDVAAEGTTFRRPDAQGRLFGP